ncbi:MAG TPA: peroxide stress protein YaaA [Pseudonocardiaceae bacterium]|nr:peroxide stress protein YaaA [Pseudonocardiaceae bacterium]
MLVLLPPSETKAEGGAGAPLDLATLSFPELNPVRAKVADALVELADDLPASLAALGISARQEAEVARNRMLYGSPTMPALRRYTGVLYDALDIGSLTPARRRHAHERLAVCSALFGLVRATDQIPAYRCSGGSGLPSLGPLPALWRPALEPVLAAVDDLVVDLRSGSYVALARVPGAVTVRVVTEGPGGKRLTVSHFNKAAKGRLARALGSVTAAPDTVAKVLTVASRAGIRLERTGEHQLELIDE